MFKAASGKSSSSVHSTHSPSKLNCIVEGVTIKGDVKASSNFRLDGLLEGTIDSTGKLAIGVSGKVIGDIVCADADVEGEIQGNIKVKGLLMLKPTARIKGNIVTGKIGVESGAQFNGNCEMGGSPAGADNSSASSRKGEKSSFGGGKN